MDHIQATYDAVKQQAAQSKILRLEPGLARDLGRSIIREHPIGGPHTHGARESEFMEYDEFIVTPYMQRGLVAIGIGTASPSSHIERDIVALWLPENVHFDYEGAEHVAELEIADLANRSPFFTRSLLVQPKFCGLAVPRRGVYSNVVQNIAHGYFGEARESCETRVLGTYGLAPLTNRDAAISSEQLLDLIILGLLKGDRSLDAYLQEQIEPQIEQEDGAQAKLDAVLAKYRRAA